MLSRRLFLQRSSLVAFAPMVPGFLPHLARAAKAQGDARVLVVIQLDGGNDGLNTVVPFRDDAYARARPTLRLPDDQLLKINDSLALHRALRGAHELLEDGRLAIVQNVGYPDPDRSHFGSMAVWHTARFTPDEKRGLGWIGAALDAAGRVGSGGPDAVYVGPEEVPRALQGRRAMTASLARADDMTPRLPMTAHAPSTQQAGGDDLAGFVRKRVLESAGSAQALAEAARDQSGSAVAGYPDTALGQRLSLTSRLIKAGGATRVYYVTQTGYDTHGAQSIMHAELLSDLGGSLRAFMKDLRDARLDDRVMVMAFSEFGRRVAENSSQGTDHGTAGPVFLAGAAVRSGLHGHAPDLRDLEAGDLKMKIDFRRLYATLLGDWLQIPARDALAGAFEPLPLLRPA